MTSFWARTNSCGPSHHLTSSEVSTELWGTKGAADVWAGRGLEHVSLPLLRLLCWDVVLVLHLAVSIPRDWSLGAPFLLRFLRLSSLHFLSHLQFLWVRGFWTSSMPWVMLGSRKPF